MGFQLIINLKWGESKHKAVCLPGLFLNVVLGLFSNWIKQLNEFHIVDKILVIRAIRQSEFLCMIILVTTERPLRGLSVVTKVY